MDRSLTTTEHDATARADGFSDELEQRLSDLYAELRRRARRCLDAMPPGQSVGSTDLVHEAMIKLGEGSERAWASDAHFVASATLTMRHVTIDRIKRRTAAKRGGGRSHQALVDVCEEPGPIDERYVLLVDELLEELEREHRRSAAVVRLRFFLGLSELEVAGVLGVAQRTIRRDWVFAKAWLAKGLRARGFAVPESTS